MFPAACSGLTTPISDAAPPPQDEHARTGSPNGNLPANVSNDSNVPDPNSLTGDPNLSVPEPNPFLTLANQKLSLRGKPLVLVGYQASLPDVTNYCNWTSAQLADAMNAMQNNSEANAVRVWFLESAGGPGQWTAFDRFIAQARAHNLLIIATLVNQWGDCEPNHDAGEKNYKTLSWYQSGYKQLHDGYPLSFRDYAKAVAEHYAGETAIGMWQLVNEAEARDPVNNSCPSEQASARAIRAFADDMVDVIHSVDTHHLINLGTQDDGYCGVSGDDFKYVHAGKVDLCEVHTYELGNVALPPKAGHYVDLCKELGKPTFLGEVGICRNVQNDGRCTGAVDANSLQRRAAFFDGKFKASLDYGMAGVLIWQLSPGVDSNFGVFPNDPVESVVRKY